MGSTRSINTMTGMPLRRRKFIPPSRARTPSSFQINSAQRSPMSNSQFGLGLRKFGNKSYQNLLGMSLNPSDIQAMRSEEIDWEQLNWEQMNRESRNLPLNRFSVTRRYIFFDILSWLLWIF